ncbi:deoxynucleoside kinase [Rummeliibacillus stabekisii]|uniref:deoxynucleoside kinase n=1 Tax=Rummeliibacillus stabekisii TaxID=241244 RepID=UPI003724973B
MSVIVVAGMIGVGKSSVTELLARELGSEAFYESVEDNPILPLFYTASEEEIQAKRYPFLLQLHFLNTRFDSIKKALVDNKNVLDRSIYEDELFATLLNEQGKISDLEYQLYRGLLHNMLQEIEGMPKKAPDVLVYLRASFETVLYRIGLRGRDFEQDESLVEYYRDVWSRYDDWVFNKYKASEVLVIDMDNTDVVNNPEDADRVVKTVKAKFEEMGLEC